MKQVKTDQKVTIRYTSDNVVEYPECIVIIENGNPRLDKGYELPGTLRPNGEGFILEELR